MRTVWYVPIEPLAERYSESWYRNIPPYLSVLDASTCVEIVDGEPLSDTVGVGTFLDINSTIAYKNSQMRKIAIAFHGGRVKNGDVFFFGDIEFWGLESLRLMADLNKIKVYIFGFLHAASYTNEDAFSIAAPYQQYTEVGWLKACDAVFVGSQYHKNAVIERRLSRVPDILRIESKIHATGNPLFMSDYFPLGRHLLKNEKKHQLVITNRFDWEKRPNLSLDFAYMLKKRDPTLNIVITTSRKTLKSNKMWLEEYARQLAKDGIVTIKEGLSKQEYHEVLMESKVMLTNSIEENFGYCIVEACLFDCAPLAKNAYSHPELLNSNPRLLFDDEDEILDKAQALLYTRVPSVYSMGADYFSSMQRIIERMREYIR